MRTLLNTLWGLLLLIGCKNNPESSNSASASPAQTLEVTLSDEAQKNAGISIGIAEMGTITQKLVVNGVIDVPPQSLISVSVPYGGFLKYTALLPGKQVSKGEVIAVLEDPSYVQLQQDYLQAIIKLNKTHLEYQRQLELRADDATSKKNFELAKSEWEMQEVLVKGLSEKLLLLGVQPKGLTVEKISRSVSVRSPIHGFVKSVFVNIGKYVNPSDVLFEIVDPSHIHASLVLYEKDFGQIYTGQRVNVFSQKKPNVAYPAEVILVSRDVDTNRGIMVHCHFFKEHTDLIPGMYIRAEIETDGQTLPLVPESAVVRYHGKHYVFFRNPTGGFSMREVTVGNREGGKIAITSNNYDWAKQPLALTGAYALLGKLTNVEEE